MSCHRVIRPLCLSHIRFAVLFVLAACFGTTDARAQSEEIIIVTEDFPPFVTDKLDDGGWLWTVTRKAFEDTDYRARLNLRPWARAVYESRHGQADALLGAYKTEDRIAHYVFSDPIAQVTTILFKNKRNRNIRFDGNLKSLQDYEIGVGRGYAVSPAFDKAEFLNKNEVVNSRTALRLLFSGHIDLLAGILEVDSYHLAQLEAGLPGIRDQIVPVRPPLKEQSLHLAVSRNRADANRIVNHFNTAVARLRETGQYAEIRAESENYWVLN